MLIWLTKCLVVVTVVKIKNIYTFDEVVGVGLQWE